MFDLEPGSCFFHYTSREAAFEHILPERRLRFSPYKRMRDPLEAQAPSLGAGMMVPDDPVEADQLQVTYMQARELLAARRAEAKLLSLTVDATTSTEPDAVFMRGYSRARMWEQYAEAHRGVCLVFQRDALTEVAERQIEERAGVSVAGPVRYTTTGLSRSGAATLMPTPGVDADQLVTEHLQRYRAAFFLEKLTDWESEHEFRFVELTAGEDFAFIEFGDALKGVILGAEFPGWQIYGALEMCRLAGAEIWQMAWELNRPFPLKPELPDGRIVEPDGPLRERQQLSNEELTRLLAAPRNRGETISESLNTTSSGA